MTKWLMGAAAVAAQIWCGSVLPAPAQAYAVAQAQAYAVAQAQAHAVARTPASARAQTEAPVTAAETMHDSIYGLTVDSTKFPEQSTVLLLDEGVVKVEADGRHTRTYRQVRQILRERAVAGQQEQRLSYDPTHEKLTVNWFRVVKPTGEVISDKPSTTQEGDVPAAMSTPVYINRKVYRASLSGVAVGTIVDASFTIEELKPFRSGDFFTSWGVTAGTTVRRSYFMIDAPKDMKLLINEHNLTYARQTTTTGGRTKYVWATNDVPWIKGEIYAADSNTVVQDIEVAAPGAWSDIGHWYAGLAHDRYAATPALRDTVHALVAKAKTFDDSLRAVHRWVAEDIRYVSIALGIGGYQPRAPDSVMRTGFGDCKDKATLFVAALGVLGIESYPVLLNAGGKVNPSLPSIERFDHAIAAIKRRGAGYEYVDLTSNVTPLGQLPYDDEDEFALVVHADGRTEEVTLPPDKLDSSRLDVTVNGTLSTDGIFNGRLVEHATGIYADGFRASMRERLDSAQRTAALRSIAAQIYPDASADSLVVFDGKDLQADPRVSLLIQHAQASTRSGTTDVLSLPSKDHGNRMSSIADELAAAGPRKLPIDAAKILPLVNTAAEFRVTLPAGWHARLPQGVTAKSEFGTYESEFRQDGAELIVRHRTIGATGIYPPDKIKDLIAWLRLIGSDQVSVILIDH